MSCFEFPDLLRAAISNCTDEVLQASSGGFSNYFPQPRYQAYAVENYLENYISKETLEYFTPFFNRSNRGFPDVAAHSLTPEYARNLFKFLQVNRTNSLAATPSSSTTAPPSQAAHPPPSPSSPPSSPSSTTPVSAPENHL